MALIAPGTVTFDAWTFSLIVLLPALLVLAAVPAGAGAGLRLRLPRVLWPAVPFGLLQLAKIAALLSGWPKDGDGAIRSSVDHLFGIHAWTHLVLVATVASTVWMGCLAFGTLVGSWSPDEDPPSTWTPRAAIGALTGALLVATGVAAVRGAEPTLLPFLVVASGAAIAVAGARMPSRPGDVLRAVEARAAVATLAWMTIAGAALADVWLALVWAPPADAVARDPQLVFAAWSAARLRAWTGAVAVALAAGLVVLPVLEARRRLADPQERPWLGRRTVRAAIGAAVLLDVVVVAWGVSHLSVIANGVPEPTPGLPRGYGEMLESYPGLIAFWEPGVGVPGTKQFIMA